MNARLFQLDAFTNRRFSGNPAAVMVLEAYPPDSVLQALAAENNLAETAFLVADAGDGWRIRWFTPTVEVPLCGHATLASAAVVMERLQPDRTEVVFASASGPLPVRRDGRFYRLDFPARPCRPQAPPEGLDAILGAPALETLSDGFNLVARMADAATVRALAPDLGAIAGLTFDGVIVTAEGDLGYDMVSRYFAPAKGIPEDSVTGGAHCALVPYWSARLGRASLFAFQASARGGELTCHDLGDRVELGGECVAYLEGEAQF